MKKVKKVLCTLLAMILVAGTWVIPAEAKTGVEQMQEIQDAIENAKDGDTIYLREGALWGTGEPIVVSGKSITVQLVGCDIESIEPYPVFKVKSGAELTIENWDRTIKNMSMPDGWQDMFGEQDLEQLGLFQVEENAKLTLDNGTFETGYQMITKNSAGKIVINGGSYKSEYQMFPTNSDCEIHVNNGLFNMIPNGEYTIPDWTCMGESMWGNGYSLVSAIKVGMPVDEIEMPPVEQELEFKVRVMNRADYPIENVEVQAGYEDSWDVSRPYYSFDKAVAGEKYTVSGAKATIPRIEAGETIWVTFSTIIPREMIGKRISFESKANIIVNGESVSEQTGGTGWFCAYQMTVDTKDAMLEAEVTKPVSGITAVKKQETENAVKKEVLQVVQDFWLYEEISAERMDSEEINKVSEGFFSGQVIKSELGLKETSVAAEEKTTFEGKARSELGEKAKLRYFAPSLSIQDESKELGTLDKLVEKMPITIAIPNELKSDGGLYKILRILNGQVEVLDSAVNKDGTITFMTDCFSTHALAYVGKMAVVENEKTEETVNKETQNVIADIVAGKIENSVIDEKTAEKVSDAVNSGKTVNAEVVVIKVQKEEIAQIEQNAIKEKVNEELGEDAKVQYLDVSIVLKAGEEELGTLNKLEEEITITVAIPDELKADGRIYKVIRNHNGEVEVLDTIVNEDGTISFKTDRFSTYALAYADRANTNTNTNTNVNAPQTGDNSQAMVYMIMCICALTIIISVKKRNVVNK